MKTSTESPKRTPQTRQGIKHEELTRTLRDLLATLEPGTRFPSQTELMRQFQVSDRTVLRSLEDLRREGRIVRRHGIGTFVADPGDISPTVPVGTNTIAALSTSLSPFYKHNIELLTEAAENAGLALICHHARFPVQFEDALPLEALSPRGFVLFTHSLMPVAKRLQERGHRVVVVGTPPVDTIPEAPCIYGDQEQGGYLATRHLLDQGHRRIAFAYRSEPHPQPLIRRLRWRGHRRALEEAMQSGIAVTESLLDPAQITQLQESPEQVRAFFADPTAPTGIVCWNDILAIFLLGLFQRAGIRVPEDVSLLGYDGLPESAESYPPLTTVQPFTEAQLRTALDLLTRESPPPSSYTIVIPPILQSRATVAMPHDS